MNCCLIPHALHHSQINLWHKHEMLQMEVVYCSGMLAAGGFVCMRWTRHPLHWSMYSYFRECCQWEAYPALLSLLGPHAAWLVLHPFVPEQRSLKVKAAQILALLSALITKSVHATEQMLYKLLSLCWISLPPVYRPPALFTHFLQCLCSAPSIHLDFFQFPRLMCFLISLLFKKQTSVTTPCPVDCVGSAEQHPAHVPRPSRLHFSANSAATLSFFYRALFSVFLLTGHQCIAFTFKVNPIEPNFILDSVSLWNSAAQKWNTLFYSLLAWCYPVFWSRALSSFLLKTCFMSTSNNTLLIIAWRASLYPCSVDTCQNWISFYPLKSIIFCLPITKCVIQMMRERSHHCLYWQCFSLLGQTWVS